MSSSSSTSSCAPGSGAPLHPALAGHPGHLLWRANARVAAITEEEQRAGVDPHAVAVLRVLTGHDEHPGAHSQQELADTVGISRTTMTRVAAALDAQGLVERVRNPTDRRSYALTPTDAGARAVRSWRERADAIHEGLAAGYTTSERDDLADLLLRVAGDEVAPDTPAALCDNLGFLIGRAHTGMHRHLLAALAPLHLEPRLYATLNLLAETGPIPQSEVARLLGISGASVVQIADDLEQCALVERRRDPADRRAQRLHVRPDADATIAQARRVAGHCIDEQLSDLSPAEVTTLVDLLHRFVTTP